MPSKDIQFEEKDDIGIITLNDGKANVFTVERISAINEHLDATEDAGAVIFTGANGRFSGGFDLNTIRGNDAGAAELLAAGAEMISRIFMHPRPVISAVNGHAIAMGAFLVLASDLRIGATGDYRMSLPEVAIGMTMPVWAMELARARLSKRYLQRAAVMAEVFVAEDALKAGFLDELIAPDQLMARAMEEATRLKSLQNPFFAGTKQRSRQETIDRIKSLS